MNIPLSLSVPENLVSRDGFSCPVPRHILHTQTESGADLRDSSRVPRRGPFILLKPPYAIGSVPSLSGHAIAYRWSSLPRVRWHRASKPQGSSERVLPWQVTMDQLICASLSHTHYWYEVGMWKVLADTMCWVHRRIQVYVVFCLFSSHSNPPLACPCLGWAEVRLRSQTTRRPHYSRCTSSSLVKSGILSLAGRWATAVAKPGYYTNRPNFGGSMGLHPKAPAWTPGPSSSGDRRGDSLGRVRRAVHGVGTHKSVDGAETLGVGGLNLYSQRVQLAIEHRVLSCMTCVVNTVFALSQPQGVEWGWPGRREPDNEHSPAS